MVAYVKRQPGGWQVQVPGKPSKLFSDSKYGGRAAARSRAAQHAQRLADKGRANPATGRFVRDPRKSEGVFRQVVRRKLGRAVYEYAYWIAAADLSKGRATQRAFSVGKYGEREAERLAREERRRMVKELLSG